MPCQTLACSHLAENKMLLATRAVARRSRVWPITTSLVEFGHPAHCTPAVGRIHHFKNCRAVCATRGPSAGAVDITPSTRRYCGADGGADPSTCRRKDLREVQIGGAGAAKEGAFGTVSRAKIMGYSNPKADAGSHGRANRRVSHSVVMPFLLGNAKDVFARQRLLPRFLPKRNSVVTERLELTLIGLHIVHHDANFPTRGQGFEIVPTAQSPLGISTARRPGREAGPQKRQHQKTSRRKRSKRFHDCLLGLSDAAK